MPIHSRRLVLALFAPLLLASPLYAITIDLEWDTSSPFYTNATARAAIEEAATDIGYWIIEPLSSLSATNTTYFSPSNGDPPRNQYAWEQSNSTSGQTLSVKYGFNYQYSTPSGTTILNPANLPANTVKMFVWGQALSGSTLGVGGSAGGYLSQSFGLSSSSGISQSLLQSQFTTLNNSVSNVVTGTLDRSGPIIRSFRGTSSVTFSAGGNQYPVSAPYSVSYGPAYGTLALDTSTTGGIPLDQYWHFDHTTPVAAGKNDLYSVALHEMLHALGVGSSETWDSLVIGTSWNGGEVIAEYGSGDNLINFAGDHIQASVMSTSLEDGSVQEVAMDPNITTGTRKYLTELDLAFLRDLNYNTRAVPVFSNQGDFNGDGLVDLADYTVWRNNLGTGTDSVINNNGDGVPGITAGDYTVWRNHFGTNYGSTIQSLSPVPEPESVSVVILLLGIAAFSIRSRQRVHLVDSC